MGTYDVRLSGREELAKGTMAFHFGKPEGFNFKPGQAIDVVLMDTSTGDAQNNRHAFSIVSAPHEGVLTVATRMRDSPFKRTLKSLAIGAQLQIEGPFGSLTLHSNPARPAVLIAGGIGITPFMSILRHSAQAQLAHRLTLLYSNRRPEDTAFLAELQALEQRNKNFRLVATMTRMSESSEPWTGETGTIDVPLIQRTNQELVAPIYYLAGPPAMVEGLRDTLNAAGIEDDDIRSEEFYGY